MPTSPPSITAIPDFPSISDRVTYNAKAYAWATALDNVTAGEISAVATNVYNNSVGAAADAITASTAATTASTAALTAVNAPGTGGTSTTSLTISTGAQSFTTQTGKAWSVGQPVVIARTSAPASSLMYGTITSYTTGTGAMVVSVANTSGSGTFTDWSISLTGGYFSAGSGQGGQVITGSVTLTSTSSAAISVTPSTYGLYVTLPDATTCTKADNLFSVYNNGDYDYGVKDSTGTQLGWVRAKTGAMIGLADSSTAAGVWVPYGLEKLAVTAKYVNKTQSSSVATLVRVTIDASRTLFVFGGTTGIYAVIYNSSTTTWGSATLVASTSTINMFASTLVSTDKVLVVYNGAAATNMSVVTLSLTGLSITVNTPISITTSGANIYSIGNIVQVGASFVAIAQNASTSAMIAITVSGTVPSLSTEQTINDTSQNVPVLFVSGSIVRALWTNNSTTLYCKPFTISGTSITPGTQATATTSNAAYKCYMNGNGNIVVAYIAAGGPLHVGIFKLTGTTEAFSFVNSSTTPSSISFTTGVFPITSSKTLIVHASTDVSTHSAFILTDTSGTASIGSILSILNSGNNAASAPGLVTSSGNTLTVTMNSSASSMNVSLDCSGTAPTLSSIESRYFTNGSSTISRAQSLNVFCERPFNALYAGNNLYTVGLDTIFNSRLTPNSIERIPYLSLPVGNTSYGALGAATNESWLHDIFPSTGAGTTGRVIIRIEAAA